MSRRDHIEKLIANHNRRLQKLEQQGALLGYSADPKIPLEIEDIKAKIEELQIEFEALEEDDSASKKVSTSENPFLFPNSIPPESFVGHRWAVEYCRTLLTTSQPQNIAISGERKIGKTSLLKYLKNFGQEPSWGEHLCLFLDCADFAGMYQSSNFWHEMIDCLQTEVALDHASPIVTQITNLQKQPVLTNKDIISLLKSFYLSYPRQYLILLLDEVELIFGNYNQTVRELLKGLRTLTRNFNLVLVVASRDPLSQIYQPFEKETGLKFYGDFIPCDLELFDREETDYVVNALLAETNLEFAPKELDYIWNLSQHRSSGALPVLVQVSSFLIFNHKQSLASPINFTDLQSQFERMTRFFRVLR